MKGGEVCVQFYIDGGGEQLVGFRLCAPYQSTNDKLHLIETFDAFLTYTAV